MFSSASYISSLVIALRLREETPMSSEVKTDTGSATEQELLGKIINPAYKWYTLLIFYLS
jgi:hypothetical protein